jgi:hypothetical protein
MKTSRSDAVNTFFTYAFIGLVGALFLGAYLALIGWIVMLLWNALLPAIFGITTISIWQAIGLMFLSGFLFKSSGGAQTLADRINGRLRV